MRRHRVREVDFRRPNKFNREQVRRLEHAHDGFCQSASSRLSAELRTELQLSVVGTDQLPYSVVMGEEVSRHSFVSVLRVDNLGTDPVTISGESGAVTLGALMFAMDLPEYADLREALGLGPSSQVLLINTERNTDPDDFRRVVWEGGTPVPERYRQAPRGLLES